MTKQSLGAGKGGHNQGQIPRTVEISSPLCGGLGCCFRHHPDSVMHRLPPINQKLVFAAFEPFNHDEPNCETLTTPAKRRTREVYQSAAATPWEHAQSGLRRTDAMRLGAGRKDPSVAGGRACDSSSCPCSTHAKPANTHASRQPFRQTPMPADAYARRHLWISLALLTIPVRRPAKRLGQFEDLPKALDP